MSSRLFISVSITLEEIASEVVQYLRSDRYHLCHLESLEKLKHFIENNKEQIDCLLVLNELSLTPIFNSLYEQGILLPVVIIDLEKDLQTPASGDGLQPIYQYHQGEIHVSSNHLDQLASKIAVAITRFLHLGPSCTIDEREMITSKIDRVENKQNFLLLQQRRLADKLKERLGYLGVYYKRNSQQFYRNLSPKEKQKLTDSLAQEYRLVTLEYFANSQKTNQLIDSFVTQAFLADIAVPQILEMHMELMDEFAQQLKLEGRSEEVLIDYRLVLIDVIAHLCEMYRRSIPREDIPFDVLFPQE